MVFGGNKTYIAAGVMGLATVLHTSGLIDAVTYQLVMGLFGAGGLAALRVGVKKGKEE